MSVRLYSFFLYGFDWNETDFSSRVEQEKIKDFGGRKTQTHCDRWTELAKRRKQKEPIDPENVRLLFTQTDKPSFVSGAWLRDGKPQCPSGDFVDSSIRQGNSLSGPRERIKVAFFSQLNFLADATLLLLRFVVIFQDFALLPPRGGLILLSSPTALFQSYFSGKRPNIDHNSLLYIKKNVTKTACVRVI